MSQSSVQQDEALEALVAQVVDEFRDRQQRGEQPQLEEYTTRYPHAAELLRKVLTCWQLIGLSAAAGPAAPEEPVSGVLGDFRILREIGRGGMGVVYEAEQISLGRRVALKVLPFAAMLDPRRLQRFQNEARAAAGLHHTNIVPVYSVSAERGIHFYAMQHIDGQPLSELIRQLRQAEKQGTKGAPPPPTPEEDRTAPYQPLQLAGTASSTVRAVDVTPLTGEGKRGRDYYRRVAELGVQAAEALDHAHQVGIVHRDVKPANLLLDQRGQVWVTDFGLAHVQQGEASLTMTGDLVGTLRYMSPEQALAKRVPIDHRTDVYSLGATLYELLTLRPVFAGTDRQEILRQISFEEPQSPRRWQRGLPAELETIVLKALEKNPAERYATAQELAEDLRHFLRDEPIRARRPTLLQRGRRWARRHQPVVWAVAVVLLLAAMLGSGTWVWLWQKQVAAEREVERVLQDAVDLQEHGKKPEALAAAERAASWLPGATINPDLQRRVRQRLADLKMDARLEEILLLRAEFKEEAFDYGSSDTAYEEAFREYGIDVAALPTAEATERIQRTSIPVELAAALVDWSWCREHLRGKNDPTWKGMLALARAADADEWRNRIYQAFEQHDAKALKKLAASKQTADLSPSTLVLMGVVLGHTGAGEQAVALLRRAQQKHPGDFGLNFVLGDQLTREGQAHWDEAIRFYSAALALRPRSAAVHTNLGNALKNKGRLDEAIAEYQEAIRLNKDFVEAHNNLGYALWEKGRLDEAIAECQEAIRLNKDYAPAHTNLGIALHDKGQLDEAIAEYQEAIRLKKDFAQAHNNLGIALKEKGRLDDAIAEYQEAIRLKKNYPEAHSNLGNALQAKGLLEEAIAEYQKAIRLKKNYPEAHSNLGNALQAKGRLDEAIAEYREAIRLNKDFAKAHNNLGIALQAKGRLDEAIAEYQEVIRLNKDFAEAYCNLGGVLLKKGAFAEALGYLRRGHEIGSRKPRWPYPSAQWVQRCERLLELDGKLPALLSGQRQPTVTAERLSVAWLCQQPYKQFYSAAARWYTEAFAAEPHLAADLQAGHRYNAACAAALASCGQGEDAARLDGEERGRLRRQALDWLQADLAAWGKLLEKEPDKLRVIVQKQMQHWQQDNDFAAVREPEALARLPEAERQAWQQLWAEVADTLARAQENAVPPKKADPK